MANQSDSQIGIQFPLVHLAERDNVDLIEHRNQGLDNPVNTCGFIRQAQVRPSHRRGRLSTQKVPCQARRDQAGGSDGHHHDRSQDHALCGH